MYTAVLVGLDQRIHLWLAPSIRSLALLQLSANSLPLFGAWDQLTFWRKSWLQQVLASFMNWGQIMLEASKQFVLHVSLFLLFMLTTCHTVLLISESYTTPSALDSTVYTFCLKFSLRGTYQEDLGPCKCCIMYKKKTWNHRYCTQITSNDSYRWCHFFG